MGVFLSGGDRGRLRWGEATACAEGWVPKRGSSRRSITRVDSLASAGLRILQCYLVSGLYVYLFLVFGRDPFLYLHFMLLLLHHSLLVIWYYSNSVLLYSTLEYTLCGRWYFLVDNIITIHHLSTAAMPLSNVKSANYTEIKRWRHTFFCSFFWQMTILCLIVLFWCLNLRIWSIHLTNCNSDRRNTVNTFDFEETRKVFQFFFKTVWLYVTVIINMHISKRYR